MREVRDEEAGVTWTCAQAYAGLSQDGEAAGDPNGEQVIVATPSGGARSVRLRLAGDWRDELADDELLARIRTESERQDAERQDAQASGA